MMIIKQMNYYIAFVRSDGFEWAVIESTEYRYINTLFDNLTPPPEYHKELRATTEDIDTHLSYEVIKREV